MKRKLLIISIIVSIAVTSAWVVYALPGKEIVTAENINLSLAENEEELPVTEATEDEKQILQTLREMFEGVGDSASYSYVRGSYSYADPADSSYNIEETEIEYCIRKDSLYYRTKDMIILNTPLFYANLDKELKRIIVSSARTNSQQIEFPLNDVSKFYKKNGYKMERTVSDSQGTIRILNNNHLNCREIEIEYNTVSMKPVFLVYRFTDPEDPLNNHLDKIMRFRVKEWTKNESEVRTKLFPHIVDIKNDLIEPSAELSGYGIINLLND